MISIIITAWLIALVYFSHMFMLRTQSALTAMLFIANISSAILSLFWIWVMPVPIFAVIPILASLALTLFTALLAATWSLHSFWR